jgi:hypothetical protein
MQRVLQMTRFGYLLILLLLWGQVDDSFAIALSVPSAPVTDDDDDDYLPSQRPQQEEESSDHTKPAFVSLESPTVDISLVRRGLPFERNLIAPFTPPPLYVFMSLQI